MFPFKIHHFQCISCISGSPLDVETSTSYFYCLKSCTFLGLAHQSITTSTRCKLANQQYHVPTSKPLLCISPQLQCLLPATPCCHAVVAKAIWKDLQLDRIAKVPTCLDRNVWFSNSKLPLVNTTELKYSYWEESLWTRRKQMYCRNVNIKITLQSCAIKDHKYITYNCACKYLPTPISSKV